MLCIDFETEGIVGNPIHKPPKPVGVSIKPSGLPSHYYAWGHPSNNNCTFMEGRQALLGAIRAHGHQWLGHNSQFECAVLRQHFLYVPPDPLKVHDTMFLLFLVNPYAYTFSLKPSAESILGMAPDEQTDPHAAVQAIIKELLDINMPRKYVKITGFGIMYGRGVPNLSAALGVPVEEGKKLRDAYFTALPEVRDLADATRRRGRSGLAIRTWGGRAYFREPNLERDLSYKLLNYLIQGSAADQTKQSIIDHDANKGSAFLLAAVHDEMNISSPEEDQRSNMELLRLAMDAPRFDVPFASDGFVGPNWADIVGYV